MQHFINALIDTRTELTNLLHAPPPAAAASASASTYAAGSAASGGGDIAHRQSTTSNTGMGIGGTAGESRRILHLRLKQQLILSYLLHHTGRKDEEQVWDIIERYSGFNLRMEKEEERERKARIVAAASLASAEASDGGAKAGDGIVNDEDEEHDRRASLSAGRGRPIIRDRYSAGSRLKDPPPQIQQQQQQQAANIVGLSAQQRLERIKKGTGAAEENGDGINTPRKRVTFAASEAATATAASSPTGTTTTSTKRRKKQSMMAMRRIMDIQSGVAEQRKENEKEVERRRKRREERRERRRQRTERVLNKFVEGRRSTRRAARSTSRSGGEEGRTSSSSAAAAASASSRKQKMAESESDEAEFEFDGDTAGDAGGESSAARPTSNTDRDGEEEEVDSNQSAVAAAIAEQTPPKQTVSCPLCGDQVEVDSDADADTVLSAHIDECQRRRGGRSRRAGRRAVSYAEDAHEEEKKSDQPPARAASSSSRGRRGGDKKRAARRSSSVSSSANSGSDSDSVMSPSSPPPEFQPSDLDATGEDEELDNLPFHTAPDDLEEANYDDRVDVWQEVGVQKMKDMAERDDENDEPPPGAVMHEAGLVVPAWMNNRLFGYQRTGLRWMWELHRQGAGGVVGDEMGLGKTVQVCGFLGAMAACRKLNSVVIICPATMLRHWMTELAVWAPGLRRILIHKSGESDGLTREVSGMLLRRLDKWLKRARGDMVNEAIDDKDYDEYDEDVFCGTGYVVVTTYDAIRRNPDTWTTHQWNYVVMDEGQKIRNPDADVTLACKRFRTPHRLLLSGTPIQNDLKELWSLFDFVFPGRLGTLPTFEQEFADPIKRGGYTNASPMQVQLAYRCALVLRDLINPYLLRRQKKDIKEVSRMPGKTEQVLFCRLSGRQRTMYESYLRSDDVMSALRGSNQTFKAITVLRKICNHPDLVTGPNRASYESFLQNGYVNDGDLSSSSDEEDYDDDEIGAEEGLIARSGKLEVLAKILPLWKKQGHRVLIFCQWTKMLSIIEKFVNMQGWKFGRLDGKTNIAARQRLVDSFNSDKSYFGMLLTTRTGGVGLNLTGANRIILYDPDWNPQTDAQARERAWRFGQTKEVTVYRLITAGAIEERIYHRQIFKNAISSAVLVDPKQRRLFSQKDLRDLFTLKADVGSVKQGGDGMTETGELTKGGGVIDPEDVADGAAGAAPTGEEGKQKDNQDTLEAVMKSKGLAGVFDHDFVDKSSSRSRRSISAREMEEQATNVAHNAARALRESTAGQTQEFAPTWTGSSGAQPRRFGGGGGFGGSSSAAAASSRERSFGGAGSAGIAASSQGRPASSGAFLSHLQQRNAAAATSSRTDTGDTSGNSELLKQIRAYIRRKGGTREGGGPTTDQILAQFDSVPNHDAAVFRRMLLSVAKRGSEGRWRLK